MSLAPILSKLRRRPGLYIGTPSLTRLAAFLRGYDSALHDLQGTPANPFFLSFQKWVSNRLQSGPLGWDTAILQHTTSEEEAFDRFWELYDEYVTQSANGAPAVAQQRNHSPVEQEFRP